jgi:hypothetical protein
VGFGNVIGGDSTFDLVYIHEQWHDDLLARTNLTPSVSPTEASVASEMLPILDAPIT